MKKQHEDGRVVVMSWNAHGLDAHLAGLEGYLTGLSARDLPDVICVQETNFTEKIHSSLSGYCAEHRFRPVRKIRAGGVSTYIKNFIPYTVHRHPGGLESITVQLVCRSGAHSNKRLTVHNIYHPPAKSTRELFRTEYTRLFSDPDSVIVGDLNAKSSLFGSDTVDERGRMLEDLALSSSSVCLNTGEGTHIKRDGTLSPLDVAFVSTSLFVGSAWSVLDDPMGSDHLPTITVICRPVLQERDCTARWMYERARWSYFQEDCARELTSDLVDRLDPLGSYERLTDTILSVAGRNIPESRQTGKTKVKRVPYWNNECAKAVELRNKALKRMRITHDYNDCNNYRYLKGVAQYTIREAKKQSWRTYCGTLSDKTNVSEVWRAVRKMAGSESAPVIPTLISDGDECVTDREKADLLCKTYAKNSSSDNYSDKFKIYRSKQADITKSHVNTILNITQQNKIDKINAPFCMSELRAAVQRTRENSAPGLDRISYVIIKQIPLPGLETLLEIFNLIWRTGQLPSDWKHSIITPIYKDLKNKHDPASYRPISLTSSLCKIMERMVADRLINFLEGEGLLSDHQAGFRGGRGCIDQIMRLQDEINKALSIKQSTLAVFIDLQNAFDTLWRPGLLDRIRSLGISGHMFSFIADFLSKRTIQVRVGGSLSESLELENGTPQGSVISPLLFIIMMDGCPVARDRLGPRLSLFADDASVYQSGFHLPTITNNIQLHINKIQAWCDTVGFKISTTKTVCVLFTRMVNIKPIPITLNGQTLQYVPTAKFLGMIFDSKLQWTHHIKYIEEKSSKRLNLMRAVAGQSWGAGKRVLLTLYKALILSLLDYGCQAMGNASIANISKFTIIQNKALMIINGAMKGTPIMALEIESGVLPLPLRREALSLVYACKINSQINNPTSSILNYTTHQIMSRNNNGNTLFTKLTLPTLIKLNIDLTRPHPLSLLSDYWTPVPSQIDYSLSQGYVIYSPAEQLARSMSLINGRFVDMVQLYTDGTMGGNRRAASSVWVPSSGFERAVRLPDGLGVFTAELFAVGMALDHILTLAPDGKYVIFTDCLQAVRALHSGHPRYHSDIYVEVKRLVREMVDEGVDITIAWIPGHVGVPGNIQADRLCRQALTDNNIHTLETRQQLFDKINYIDLYIESKWQRLWNSATVGLHYKSIQPTVDRKIKYTFGGGREMETMITRLRLGKVRLNHYLHRLGLHPTGLCPACGDQETIEHYLLRCVNQSQLTNSLRDVCSHTDPTLAMVLTNPATYKIIYDYVLGQQRRL